MSKPHNLSTYGVQDIGDLAILAEIRYIWDLATQFQRINRDYSPNREFLSLVLVPILPELHTGRRADSISYSRTADKL